jgi:hypothetical protein
VRRRCGGPLVENLVKDRGSPGPGGGAGVHADSGTRPRGLGHASTTPCPASASSGTWARTRRRGWRLLMPRRHGRWPTSWGRRTSTGGRRRWRGCGTASSRSGWSGPLSRSTPVPVDRRGLLEPRRAARSHLGAVRGPPSLAVSLVCPAVRGRHVPADPRRRDRREDRAGVGGREPAGVRHTHRPVVRTPRPGPSPTPPTRPAATPPPQADPGDHPPPPRRSRYTSTRFRLVGTGRCSRRDSGRRTGTTTTGRGSSRRRSPSPDFHRRRPRTTSGTTTRRCCWHKVSRWWPWPSGWHTTTPGWSCRRTAI